MSITVRRSAAAWLLPACTPHRSNTSRAVSTASWSRARGSFTSRFSWICNSPQSPFFLKTLTLQTDTVTAKESCTAGKTLSQAEGSKGQRKRALKIIHLLQSTGKGFTVYNYSVPTEYWKLTCCDYWCSQLPTYNLTWLTQTLDVKVVKSNAQKYDEPEW